MATASEIREHMKVVSPDGKHIGIVDRVEGDRIKLTKNDPASGGEHRYIGLDEVEHVKGDEVCISQGAKGKSRAM